MKLLKREILLGIVGVAGLLIFIWGVNYLKGKDLFQQQMRFNVVYPKVDGLIESHAVVVNGVKIGQVNKIQFHPDRTGRVLVECIVMNTLDIPHNTLARLSPASLIGGFEIVLLMGDSGIFIQHGDTLQGVIQPPLQDEIAAHILPIKDQAQHLLSNIDTLVESLNRFFDDQTKSDLNVTLKELNSSMKHIESIAGNIKNQEEKINHIIYNMALLSDSLAAIEIKSTVDQANESIQAFHNLMKTVDEGQGNLTKLLHDEQLYEHLLGASRELEYLLEDIRNNPRKYFNFSVFGK